MSKDPWAGIARVVPPERSAIARRPIIQDKEWNCALFPNRRENEKRDEARFGNSMGSQTCFRGIKLWDGMGLGTIEIEMFWKVRPAEILYTFFFLLQIL